MVFIEMTNPMSSPKQDFSKPIIKVVAVIVIAVVVIAIVFTLAIPKLQEQVAPTPTAYFSFPSKTSYRTSEGGFFGIGANAVVWVEVTVKNTGDAAGGCTINAKVESNSGGGYWTKSEGVYLSVGAEQTIKFKFDSGPHNDAYSWSVWTS